jgi:transcriptional regulator GlxA family with amidase domain
LWQVTLAELARRVHAGLGMTPGELVRRMRVSQAVHLLESGHASVEEVAARVGYADSAAFRRVFRRHAGESPRGRRNRVADSGAGDDAHDTG